MTRIMITTKNIKHQEEVSPQSAEHAEIDSFRNLRDLRGFFY